MSFDPSKKHRKFDEYHDKWRRQRDVVGGEDRVKHPSVSKRYLPPLAGQPTGSERYPQPSETRVSTYESYRDRAVFMNATGRTRDGLVGAIMRKEPDVTWPAAQEEALTYAGASLDSFHEVIDETLDEVVGIGRFGHLVDLPRDADENAEPYIATYVAESIVNWEHDLIDGRRRLTMVALREKSGNVVEVDGHAREMERYRILWLGAPVPRTDEEEQMQVEDFLAEQGLSPTDFEDGLVYYQEVWDEVESSTGDGGESEFSFSYRAVPRAAGGVLFREIPFVFFNATTNRAKPEKPPLQDIAVVNLSHYRNSADYEHGMHFTALPQPYAAGFDFNGPLAIGSGYAWVTDNPQAKAGYLEFSGAGLSTLKDAMERKEKHMAALGGRLIEEQPGAGAQEAAETVKLRQAGEQSALSRIAQATSRGLTRTLGFLAQFRGIGTEVGVQLNQDFGTAGLSPQLLAALMQQVQGGLMSWPVYYFNLNRGELYPDAWTAEDEAAAIIGGPPGGGLDAALSPDREDRRPPDDDEGDDDDEG